MECLSKKHLLDPCLKLIELKMKIQRNKAEILINKIHVYKAGQQKYQKKAAFLAFIAKRFCHAGLRDIAIKCGVIDVGTVGRLLDYKAYKRQISYYKVIYETC